jgi:TrpR-related protein YerC/YecD
LAAEAANPADSQAAAPEEAAEDPTLALCQALLALPDAATARRFLVDLCTPGEIRALSERWHVARLLDEGRLSYRQISEATGVSTATIVRVARFLRDEPHQGYRAVLDKLNEQPREP